MIAFSEIRHFVIEAAVEMLAAFVMQMVTVRVFVQGALVGEDISECANVNATR